MAESPLIAIVDDDASIRDALTSLLRAVSWRAEGFASAEAFLQSGQVHTTACLLLDAAAARGQWPGAPAAGGERPCSPPRYGHAGMRA